LELVNFQLDRFAAGGQSPLAPKQEGMAAGSKPMFQPAAGKNPYCHSKRSEESAFPLVVVRKHVMPKARKLPAQNAASRYKTGFVAAVPFRVFRNGTGTFAVETITPP
jgi:hypothetical protein